MANSAAVKPLLLGETFETWADLYKSIADYGVSAERWITTVKKDSSRYVGKCRMGGEAGSGCPWHLRARLSTKTELVTITGLNMVHSCERSNHYDKHMHTKSKRMADHIFSIVQYNPQTRACTLRDTLKAQIHPDIQYHTANKAKKICLHQIQGDDKESFHLIPPWCHRILRRDPGATAFWRAPDGHFSNLFVCPSASKESLAHCRPLVAFDGAHTRPAYPQCLMLATALDANQSIVLLAFCMCLLENETEWEWFLRALRTALPQLEHPSMVFVSDREKGLLDGVPNMFPNGHHVFCVWHMGENIKKHFNKEIVKMFDGLVWASTEEKYYSRLARIEEKNPAAAAYIRNTANPVHYSRAFLPGRRWGKETSQQAESENKVLKPQRSEIAFKSAVSLWDYMMRMHFEKRQLAESVNTQFAPRIMLMLKDIQEAAVNLVAQPSSETEVLITDKEGRQFIVNLEPEWRCDCGDFQDLLIPCVHAWRALTRLEKTHFQYISPYYSTETFRRTYSSSIPAMTTEDLVPDPNCGPALKVRMRGRPTEKARMRYEIESGLRNERRCRVCGTRGHDKRTCPETKGARQAVGEEIERQREREERRAGLENNTCSFQEVEDELDSDVNGSENQNPNITWQEQMSQTSFCLSQEMSYTQLLYSVDTNRI